MSKLPQITDDKLIMSVRAALKSTEPRKLPEKVVRNDYGFDCWVCPYCDELVHQGRRNQNKLARYNMHFAQMHGTPFWKEKKLIKLIRRAG